MKRFVIWIVTVIATVVVLDLGLGLFFGAFIKKRTLPGDYESIDYLLRRNDRDLLVLGSSVALNSLNTKTLEDSLGMTSFNGGGNGQTFPFFLTVLKGAVAQHAPKAVVLCVQPQAFTGADLGGRYNFLVPYYGLNISDIDANLDSRAPYEKTLLKSATYRLNTIWFRILLYHFIKPDIRGDNGYVGKPIPPSFPVKNDITIGALSSRREAELLEFIKTCNDNGIKLSIFFTPEFNNYVNKEDSNTVIDQVTEIARRHGVEVFNDSQVEPFASDSTLFYDNVHINVDGTQIYTEQAINRLKYLLNK